jgi:hypothetical protein
MAKLGGRRHFKAPDLKRLLNTLKAAGVKPGRIEVTRDGGIAVIPAGDGDASVASPLDRWMDDKPWSA